MSNDPCPDFLVQTADGTLHAYFDPAILRIHLRENAAEGVRVFSRDHRGMTLKYTEVRCLECFDYVDNCQECCEHEFDAGEGYHCLNCDVDGSESVMSDAYDRSKDIRKYGA